MIASTSSGNFLIPQSRSPSPEHEFKLAASRKRFVTLDLPRREGIAHGVREGEGEFTQLRSTPCIGAHTTSPWRSNRSPTVSLAKKRGRLPFDELELQEWETQQRRSLRRITGSSFIGVIISSPPSQPHKSSQPRLSSCKISKPHITPLAKSTSLPHVSHKTRQKTTTTAAQPSQNDLDLPLSFPVGRLTSTPARFWTGSDSTLLPPIVRDLSLPLPQDQVAEKEVHKSSGSITASHFGPRISFEEASSDFFRAERVEKESAEVAHFLNGDLFNDL